jgi:hypothetical protein
VTPNSALNADSPGANVCVFALESIDPAVLGVGERLFLGGRFAALGAQSQRSQ